MKKSRYTEEQIIAVLKEADAGMKVQDLRRKHNISDVTFCQWRSKYGGMEVSEVPLLKALVTDLSCDNQTLKLVVSKSVSAPVASTSHAASRMTDFTAAIQQTGERINTSVRPTE